jgi:hypothetical protein
MAADPWPARGDWGHLVPYNAFKRVSENYSAPERAAMFRDTATRVYRIDAYNAGDGHDNRWALPSHTAPAGALAPRRHNAA